MGCVGAVIALTSSVCTFAQDPGDSVCPRAAAGSVFSAPREVRSQNGVLRVVLSLRNETKPTGEIRYCYVDENGNQSPTLRVKPGDLLILKLKNELPGAPALTFHSSSGQDGATSQATPAACVKGGMNAASTNLHFHGLMIPPACRQDDVLRTMIAPGAPPYEYRVRIPRTQPPGLYWYHPHPHGHSEEQVLGGASGALIVEGVEHFNRLVEGLPERLLVIRDQTRVNAGEPGPQPPSKDLSVNFVPVPYPRYPPAIIRTKPSQRELWRVLNASSDTFLELHLLTNGKWQSMGLVALDGVPLGYGEAGYEKTGYDQNTGKNPVQWIQSIPLPPGGRAEFIFDSPNEGQTQLLTAGVNTVPTVDEDQPAPVPETGSPVPIPDDDDYTPPRWLVTIVVAGDAPELPSTLPKNSTHFQRSAKQGAGTTKPGIPPLSSVHPTRERRLYFSEKVMDPKNPRASTVFYLTEEGHQPSPFNPADAPNITVRQGDVEDWVIENRSQEAHTFHIHQSHFIVLQRDDDAVHENYLRDTVAVPFWDGASTHYPSVKLRIDFRDPSIVGTFPYHCHILQHEDGGMMGTVRVLKRRRAGDSGTEKVR